MRAFGPQQLRDLLDEHGAALVLYAQQWCDTPEDVVQDALLRFLRQPVPPRNTVGWLYRAVRNAAIDTSRSASRRARRESALAGRRPSWFAVSHGDHLDAAEAAAALKTLPPEQRETIVARIWGGLTLQQIADLTGSSTSTVRRRYLAGLSALRERLGVVCPEKNNTINT